MTMLNADDVRALREAGLRVEVEDGWQRRGHGPGADVRGLVVHHTAGPKTGNLPSLSVLKGGRSDLPGPLCHFALARDGELRVIAAGLAYHAGAVRSGDYSNSHQLGVEVEHSGYGRLTKAQRKTLVVLGAVLAKRKGFAPSDIRGHREVCYPRGRKIDPRVYSMTALRLAVRRWEPPRKVRRVPLADQVKALQEAVGLPPRERDGVWGPITETAVRAFQNRAEKRSASRKQIRAVRKALGLRPAISVYTRPTRRRLTALRARARK